MAAAPNRFHFMSEDDIKEKVRGRVPQNTRRNTSWSVRVWNEWAKARNATEVLGKQLRIPMADNLAEFGVDDLDVFLSHFVMEVRNKEGEPYAPDSLNYLSAGIQRYLREKFERGDINILDGSCG
ncbi:transcriptional regulator QRICH1-like [Ptychodera flava]|uniref:transcriptional regulator QRICH1-like n=1 Tax=Ptychodera flava TaxID=63121 RepID=UPI00396A965A